jgi:hypothetical protein
MHFDDNVDISYISIYRINKISVASATSSRWTISIYKYVEHRKYEYTYAVYTANIQFLACL